MSFKEYIKENKDRGNSRIDAMSSVVSSLKKSLDQYDVLTRRFIWDKLTSSQGKELMDKVIRNPGTKLSDSEFNKLAQGRVK